MEHYVFDGSMEGLLSAAFEWFERKPGQIKLSVAGDFQPDAFSPALHVHTDRKKADRVWAGLQARLQKDWLRKYYCAYLSELAEAYTALFEFTCYLFTHPAGAEYNYGNPWVLLLSQTAKKVEREKHRMEAFIRFQQTAEGIYYCGIDPDFNVLPLISKHFSDRYADQQWILYDIRRHWGLYYNLEKVEVIHMDFHAQQAAKPAADALSGTEELYARLWKDYFKSTNIAARKNMRLHTRHVPKRYWRYLTEKHD